MQILLNFFSSLIEFGYSLFFTNSKYASSNTTKILFGTFAKKLFSSISVTIVPVGLLGLVI